MIFIVYSCTGHIPSDWSALTTLTDLDIHGNVTGGTLTQDMYYILYVIIIHHYDMIIYI